MLSLIKIRTYAYYNEPSNVCDFMLNFTKLMKFICFKQWEDVIKITIIYWNKIVYVIK